LSTIRVNLITYRRPKLLPRAIDSLRAQTFQDWTCEVQNGDPADGEPGRLLASIGDTRFRLALPPRRMGPVEAFNLVHQPAAEPWQSLLEDDNWWEPGFLAGMLQAVAAHPEVELAWSNMRVWSERADGGWEDTGRCIWNLPAGTPARVFRWPQLAEFSDCLYSNGSMLLRSRAAGRLIMPVDISRDMIEQGRERLMNFPILLVPAPLANFAVTRQTMRSTDHGGWGETQTLLGAAFLQCVPMSPGARAALWAHRRSLRPRSTATLFSAALAQRDWSFLRHATVADWTAFLRGALRRPGTMRRMIRAKRLHPETWRWLLEITAARTAEARERGFTVLTEDSVIDKQNP